MEKLWREVTPRRSRDRGRGEQQRRWQSEVRQESGGGGARGLSQDWRADRRPLSAAGPRRAASPGAGAEVQQSLEVKVYEKHFKRVACPLCSASLPNIVSLAKHLDENCESAESAVTTYTTCQLRTDRTFACDLCECSVATVEECLSHLYGRSHLLRCRKFVTGKMLQLMRCRCCEVQIPCTYIQINFHLRHEIHRVKRESALPSLHTERGIYIIYCLKNKRPVSRCLFCSFESDVMSMGTHMQYAKHKALKGCRMDIVYCCFCQEELLWSQVKFHCTSKEHTAKEKKLSAPNAYNLCLFCGLSFNTHKQLSLHMRSDCLEVKKVQEEVKTESGGPAAPLPGGRETAEEAVHLKGGIDEAKSILVKGDVDIVELFHTLKSFGKIKCVDVYDEENIVIEFKSRSTVAELMLVRRFIKVHGEQVDFKLFEEQCVKGEAGSEE